MKKLNYQSIKFKLKYLLTLFIPVVVIGSYILLLLKSKDIKNNFRQIKAIEKIKVEKINNVLLNDISSTSSDLMYLSQNLQLKRYLNGQINDLSDIEKEFLSFSENKKLYGQIRYIDESGMEKIRINYNKGNPYIVRRENLQNKLSRYYFKDTIKLNKKDIFGRYEGDEFLLILPHTTINGGNKVAEKIKNKIEENQFKIKGINFHVTFSVWISQLDQSMKNIDDLIEKSDISLYKSKEIKKACDQDVQSLA